eukprot:2737535-Rhodomonas_salina.1
MPGTDLGVPGIVMSTGIAAVPPLAPDVLPMHQQWKPRGGSLNPPPIFLAAGGMKVLVSMLQSPEEKVQLQAVGALSEACNGNPSNQVPFPLRPLPPPQPVVAKQTQDSARHGKMVTWSGASGTDGVGERGGHAGAGAAHAQWDRHGSVQGRRCHLRRLHGLPPASRLLLSVADCGTTRTQDVIKADGVLCLLELLGSPDQHMQENAATALAVIVKQHTCGLWRARAVCQTACRESESQIQRRVARSRVALPLSPASTCPAAGDEALCGVLPAQGRQVQRGGRCGAGAVLFVARDPTHAPHRIPETHTPAILARALCLSPPSTPRRSGPRGG